MLPADAGPSTCSASASSTTSSTGIARRASTSSTAPSRPGSPATAWRWRRCPSAASASTSASARNEDEAGPLVAGCPCPACTGFSRAYVHYLSRAEELTGVRLLTLHNLVYTRELIAGAREAIVAGRYAPTATRSSPARRPGRPPGPDPAPAVPLLAGVVLDELLEVAGSDSIDVVADELADVGVLAGVGGEQDHRGDQPGDDRDEDDREDGRA